jgi:hypothetical protein
VHLPDRTLTCFSLFGARFGSTVSGRFSAGAVGLPGGPCGGRHPAAAGGAPCTAAGLPRWLCGGPASQHNLKIVDL